MKVEQTTGRREARLPPDSAAHLAAHMNQFFAYGLAVRSEIPVPFLASAASTAPDVHVRFGEPHVPAGGIVNELGHRYAAGEALLSFPDARMGITDGREITVSSDPGIDAATLQPYLLGPALGVALLQRRTVVLHAAALRVRGKVVAIAADSGVGKSTLSARLAMDGAELISEDVLPVTVESGTVYVGPGIPVIKLWPGALSLLMLAANHENMLDPVNGQHRLRVQTGLAAGPAPLDLLVVLDPVGPRDPVRLQESEAFLAVTRNSYGATALHPFGMAKKHFQVAVDISRRVPAVRLRSGPLHSPNDLGMLVGSVLARL